MKDPRLIAVVTTGTSSEAAAARNILESRGIRVFVDPPGDARAMPPGGVFRVLVLAEDRGAAEEALASPVMVRTRDLAAARETLIPKDGITDEDWQAPPDLANEPLPKEELPPADGYARMAAILSVVWVVFPPLLLAVPYCLVRAVLAAGKQPPRDATRYQKNTAIAFVFGILLPCCLIVWWFYSSL